MNANYEKTAQRISQTAVANLYYGISKQGGNPVAIKTYDFTTEDPRATLRELSVMKRLHHENLIKFFNYFESAEQTVLVTELAQTELLQYIIERRYYCEDDCRGYVQQILKAVDYLHRLNTPHLNLKPENVLIHDQVVKLSDFNLHSIVPAQYCITAPGFAAPEQLLGQSHAQEPDIYAVGVLTHLLLTGRLPFGLNADGTDFVRETVQHQLAYEYELKIGSMSKNAQDFIKSCLRPPKQRADIQQLLGHPWITEVVPVIPLTGTQMQLKKYLAQLRLRNGSSVSHDIIQQIVKTINNIKAMDDSEEAQDEVEVTFNEEL